MRIFVSILLFSIIVNTGRGQDPAPVLLKSDARVRIHKLSIDATGLPNGDREQITRVFEHHDSFQGELQPRIEQKFRDLGYFKARVDEPTISFLRHPQRTEDVDVWVKVDQGVQYRLGEIRFERAHQFPVEQMRARFQIQTGDLLSVTNISKGLDELRNLYATEGYINMVATPVVCTNESHRTVDILLELDEGEPFDFGRLFLDGTEPYPGAYKTLMESWESLRGKRYSPLLLKSWLTANASAWPGPRDLNRIATNVERPELHAVDIKLQLQ